MKVLTTRQEEVRDFETLLGLYHKREIAVAVLATIVVFGLLAIGGAALTQDELQGQLQKCTAAAQVK